MIEYWKYIILALIQGITEILPVSSSGHLILVSSFFELPANDLSLSIFLHLASALAVIVFFHRRIKDLIAGFFLFIFCPGKRAERKQDFSTAVKLIVATVPAGIAGILFQGYIEENLMSPFFLGLFFTLTGLLLIFSTQIHRPPVALQDLKYHNSLFIGLFQMIGILPGISRSGITYIGTKMNRLDSDSAAEFIFLLFLPVSLGSGLIESVQMISSPVSIDIFPVISAFIVALLTTLIALKLFLSIIKKDKMYLFSYYLIPLGILLMTKGLYISTF